MRAQVLWFAAIALPAACGGNPSTSFGPPDGLVGKSAPTATSGSSGGAPADAGSSSSSGGSSGGGSGSSGGKGMGADAGKCATSWAKDVFTLLESTGSGACGNSACHHSGGLMPYVIDGDPATTYSNFQSYMLDAIPYVNQGNTDPSQSAMNCNLVTGQCGAQAMPVAPTGTLSAMQKTTIESWLKCGAPQN